MRHVKEAYICVIPNSCSFSGLMAVWSGPRYKLGMISCASRRIIYLPSVHISIVWVGMLTSIQHVRRYYMGEEVAVLMRLAIVPKAELGALA